MTTEINDVELEALLKGDDTTEEVETSGASDQDTTADQDTANTSKNPKDAEEEYSPRAKDRIKELLDENKRLKENPPAKADKTPENKNQFNSLDEFVNAIEDEPSKQLLKTYGDMMRKEFGKDFSPVLAEINESKFNKEFAEYASRVPSLKKMEDDLKKNFLRNPNQSIKSLIGEAIAESITSRVKPIESTSSVPKRGQPDLTDASKEDLYATLESMKQ